MTRVRIKICGITRREDALQAADAGADAIGLVFHPESPRAVTGESARAIACALPPFVSRTGLFVNAEPEFVHAMLAVVPIDLLQFHGDERPDYCRAFRRPYIKAVRMRDGIDLASVERQYTDAAALLLDAWAPDAAGGTGRTFDWDLVPGSRRMPVVLAGGLTTENVAEAIRRVRPWAVDVSGGVESAKGIKDPGRVRAFIAAVRGAA
jgi:phosphoribosylanthranilate isomerase